MFRRGPSLYLYLLVAGILMPQVRLWGQEKISAERFATKLYMDFTGQRPSRPQIIAFADKLAGADNEAEVRGVIKAVLVTDLMRSDMFVSRLKNYFNGVFGVGLRHGTLTGTMSVETARDFRDEAAMYMAAAVTGLGGEPADIRNVLSGQKTVMTPKMASALQTSNVLRLAIGLGGIDSQRLGELSLKNSDQNLRDKWYWIQRDATGQGLATGTPGHVERHAGILTTPVYLTRNASHLARANNYYSWLLCRTVEQNKVAESQHLKLMERQPCAGCHGVLEPLGSFWVHWRAKIQPDNFANWVLDGVGESGKIPADAADPSSVHSRSVVASYHGKTGTGVRALADIGRVDSDFPQCMAQHAWQFLHGRSILDDESGWAKVLGLRLAGEYQWDLREVMVDIVLSESYLVKEGSDDK